VVELLPNKLWESNTQNGKTKKEVIDGRLPYPPVNLSQHIIVTTMFGFIAIKIDHQSWKHCQAVEHLCVESKPQYHKKKKKKREKKKMK
jgi:hypothetical protein